MKKCCKLTRKPAEVWMAAFRWYWCMMFEGNDKLEFELLNDLITMVNEEKKKNNQKLAMSLRRK